MAVHKVLDHLNFIWVACHFTKTSYDREILSCAFQFPFRTFSLTLLKRIAWKIQNTDNGFRRGSGLLNKNSIQIWGVKAVEGDFSTFFYAEIQSKVMTRKSLSSLMERTWFKKKQIKINIEIDYQKNFENLMFSNTRTRFPR